MHRLANADGLLAERFHAVGIDAYGKLVADRWGVSPEGGQPFRLGKGRHARIGRVVLRHGVVYPAAADLQARIQRLAATDLAYLSHRNTPQARYDDAGNDSDSTRYDVHGLISLSTPAGRLLLTTAMRNG